MAEIRLGTSAFTAAGWSFYPKGMKPAEFLTFYATMSAAERREIESLGRKFAKPKERDKGLVRRLVAKLAQEAS